jgi:soluble lytic murein transglycosylase-like protein
LGGIVQARWWLTVVLGMFCGTAVHAQVYEITPDGGMMIREGGGSVRWHAAQEHAATPLAATDTALPPITQAMSRAAARHRISPQLLEALVWQESRWHADAVSPKGARGLTQLMPGTARSMGVDPRDPAANLDGGAHYLRLMLDHFDGDLELALAAYNAGPARVERSRTVPPITETRKYVASIMDRLGGHALQSCVTAQNCPEALP